MIVPSIDIMNGRAVQLRQGKELVMDGGDPLERLAEFAVVGEVAVIDLDAAMGTGSNTDIIKQMVRQAPCRVGGGIRTRDIADHWLNAGAAKIIIGTAASPEFCGQFPKDRVIAAVDARDGKIVVDGWRERTNVDVLDRIRALAPTVGGFLMTQVEHEGELAGFDLDLVERAIRAAGDATLTAAGGITTVDHIRTLDVAGADAQVGMAIYTGSLTLGAAFTAALGEGIRHGEDDQSTWPTVIVDEHNVSLGLVWSTCDSVHQAIASRQGVYWSRSRHAIWKKGATSGNRQELVRIELDCDRDALRFVVRQSGSGFCHRNTRSCWGDSFDLFQLERTISDRLKDPVNKSGTTKLLEDADLLAAKLSEEANELATASGVSDAVHETADLLYFALVALKKHGGSLDRVNRELALRRLRTARRPMEKKPSP